MTHSGAVWANGSRVVACDPGKGGGWAFYNAGGMRLKPMPDSVDNIVLLLRSMIEVGINTLIIERLPRFVGVAVPSSTMTPLWENYGVVLGAAKAIGYSIEQVNPREWQKAYGIGTRSACKSSAEWKGKLRDEAKRLYPGLSVTLQTADALLIWHWRTRMQGMKAT